MVLAGVAATFVAFGAPAAAHGPQSAEPGLSEGELRSYESFVLGPEHAAEHARERSEDADDPAARANGAASELLEEQIDSALATPGGAYDEHQSLQAALADDLRAQDGEWTVPFDLPLYAIHAALLPTGKVFWMGPPDPGFGDADDTLNTTWAVLWDPLSGQLERVDPPLWRDPADGQLKPANLYCAGQAFLASGELLVAGGTLGRDEDNQPFGLNKVYSFDPFSETWTEQPDMQHGRWYPTNVQLPDGRQAIMSGSNELGASEDFYNETIEIFNPASGLGGQGTLTTLLNASGNPAERGTSGQPPTGGLYPHMFAMPSGKTLVAGPFQTDSWYLHAPGATNRLAWSDTPNLSMRRRYATGVIVPPAPGDTTPSTKALLLGGYGSTSDPATNQKSLRSTEYFDDATPGSGWRAESQMQVGRSNQNTVLLPDGSMVQVGGGVGADLYGTVPDHLKVELWDPATKQWRLGAAQQEKRAYHSTAVLLPDGRVVSAGDDGNPGGTDPLDTAEVYSPPYLFKGPRPTISSAPATVELSDSFDVGTPNQNIARAALIAPGATTHANDMHQRYVPLELTEQAAGVQLTAPPNANAAPPGYYMLFLIDDAGVPSIAKFVKLVADQPDGDGEITIVKQTTPAGAPDSFNFTGDLGSFSLADDGSETETLPAGTYDVTESTRAGWTLTALSCNDGSTTNLAQRRAEIQLSAGESVTCTFTNTKDPEPEPDGEITILKQTTPAGAPDSFGFTGDLGSFSLADDGTRTASLPAGTYDVTESTRAGWTLTALSCSDGSTTNLAQRRAQIELSPGESVTCTFSNAKDGEINIVKQTTPAGAPDSFGFTGELGSFSLADDGTKTASLPAGTYDVTESTRAGWTLTALSCSDGSTTNLGQRFARIQLSAGESVTCTFTNTKDPDPDGEITIVKQTNLPGAVESFDFSGDLGSFSLAHGGTRAETRPAGTYDVTESVRAGWRLTALSCDDGNSTTSLAQRQAQIQLSPGESVTCTFTSTPDPDPDLDPEPDPDPSPPDEPGSDPVPSPGDVPPAGDPDPRVPDITQPNLTQPTAAAFATKQLAKRLGRGAKLTCKPRSGGFRCTFKLGRSYTGTFFVRDAGAGKAGAGRLTYKGTCGGPRVIRTTNLTCPAARLRVGQWLRDKPLPSVYDCDEQPAPKRTTCEARTKAFSFVARGS